MYTRLAFSVLLMGCLLAEDAIQVGGAVTQPLTLTMADLARMPRASVKATIHEVETTYQGVWLADVLKKAGVPQGKDLRGKALAGYVLAQGQDGYQVLFSVAELDPGFVDNQILLADQANGKPLSSKEGPFRLIVPKDKPGARSLRMLTKLEVVQLRKQLKWRRA